MMNIKIQQKMPKIMMIYAIFAVILLGLISVGLWIHLNPEFIENQTSQQRLWEIFGVIVFFIIISLPKIYMDFGNKDEYPSNFIIDDEQIQIVCSVKGKISSIKKIAQENIESMHAELLNSPTPRTVVAILQKNGEKINFEVEKGARKFLTQLIENKDYLRNFTYSYDDSAIPIKSAKKEKFKQKKTKERSPDINPPKIKFIILMAGIAAYAILNIFNWLAATMLNYMGNQGKALMQTEQEQTRTQTQTANEPDYVKRYWQGREWEKSEQHQRVLDECLEIMALAQEANDSFYQYRIYKLMGRAYYYLANYSEAEKCFNKAVNMAPEDNYREWMWRGLARYHNKDKQRALEDLKRSKEMLLSCNDCEKEETLKYITDWIGYIEEENK